MKKFVALYISLVIALGVMPITAVKVSADELTDVARGGIATSNGAWSPTPPSQAVDGSESTYFNSNTWTTSGIHTILSVDLRDTYQISKVSVTTHSSTVATKYTVYYSSDGNNWTEIGTTPQAASSVLQEIEFTPVSAKHVRIVSVNGLNCQIRHLKVWGAAAVPPDFELFDTEFYRVYTDDAVSNLALGKSVTANGNYSSGPPANAVDGRDDTTFNSANRTSVDGFGTFPVLTVDLGASALISKVVVIENHINDNYDVYYSENGTVWTSLGTTITTSGAHLSPPIVHELTLQNDVSARYVRVVYRQNSNCQIRHFQVFGKKAAAGSITERIYSVRDGEIISKVNFHSDGTKDLSTLRITAELYKSIIGGWQLVDSIDGFSAENTVNGDFSITASLYDVPKYGHKIKVSVYDGAKNLSPSLTGEFGLPMFYDSSKVSHPISRTSGNLNYMLVSSDRTRIDSTENTAAKIKAQLSSTINLTEAAYIDYLNNTVADMRNVDVPSALKNIAQRYASLYARYEKDNSHIRRAVLAMYVMAKNYKNVVPQLRDTLAMSYNKFIPDSCIYLYNEIYNEPVWNTLSTELGEDVKAVVEDWFVRSVYTLFEVNNGEWLTNITPYGLKQIYGTAAVLGSPDMIRRFLGWTDTLIGPKHFHSDGMWHEGTRDYHSQTIGNFKEAMTMLQNIYSDPADYAEKDHMYGLNLKKTNLAYRYPILNLANNILNIMRFPDGANIAIHDAYASTANLNVQSKTINNDLMKNIELNSFGHFALTLGDPTKDKLDTTQVHLTFPPVSEGIPYGGGHYHGNFLSMILWGGGVEAFPDAGYPNKRASGNRFYFHMNTVTHNTPWVWKAGADNYSSRQRASVRQALLKYDDGSSSNKAVQLIEASSPGPEGDQVEMKRRLLMLVRLEGNRGYVFDLQRLKGGDAHEMYLRASEDEDVTSTYSGISLTQQSGTLASYLSSIGKTQGLSTDRDLLQTPKTASGNAPFNFEWKGVTSGSSVKTFVNQIEGSEVFFSQMPTFRRTKNEVADFYKYPNPHLYRRKILTSGEKSAGSITKFASVYETFRGTQSGLISEVEYLLPADGDQMAYGVKVTSNSYVDTIYVSEDDIERVMNGITFKSKAAVVRKDILTGEVLYEYIFGEGEIYTDGMGIVGIPDAEFSITDTDIGASFISDNRLTLDKNLPENVKPNDWIITSLGDGTGFGYKINGIENNKLSLITPPDFEINSSGAQMIFFPTTNMPAGKSDMSLNNPLRIISGDARAYIYKSVFEVFEKEELAPKFYNKTNQTLPIRTITNEADIVVKINMANSGISPMKADMVMVLYEGGKIKDIKISPSDILGNLNGEFNISGLSAPKIEVILLDGIESLRPLLLRKYMIKK